MAAATIVTANDLTLHRRDWPCADAHGSVVLVHGLGEHIGRYEHVAAQLNAWGWRVTGVDQRGHGASPGPRGALVRDDDPLRDLACVVDAVRAEHPGESLVLLGHSMGGLIAARFVAEQVRTVDALVLSSPALDAGMNPFQKGLLALLGPIAPNLAVGNGLKPAWISRDPAVVRAYVEDPLVHDRVTPRLVRFIVDGGALVIARAGRWQVPTLLIYAGSDRCVAPAGSAAFAAAAPKQVLSVRAFPALYHEIFNEPERTEVFAVLRDWLASRAVRDPARRSGPGS